MRQPCHLHAPLLAFAFLLPNACAAIAAAQEVAADTPDVMQILRDADAAARSIRTVVCTAESFGTGAWQDRFPRSQAKLYLRKVPGEVLPQIRAEISGRVGRSGTPYSRSVLTSDGESVLQVYPEERVAIRGVLPEAARLLEPLQQSLMMTEFAHPKPFEDELKSESVTYEGTQDIHGVECHKLVVFYVGGTARARWYLSIEDKLPRRVDRIDGRSGLYGARALELRDAQFNVELPLETFATIAPKDFRVDAISSRAKVRAEPRQLPPGSIAPDFVLRDLAGRDVTLAQHRGKVVVLAFWSTWHAPAAAAPSWVEQVIAAHPAESVSGLAVHAYDRPAADARSVTGRGALARTVVLLDGDPTAEAYRVDGVPTYYVIGRSGHIRQSFTGAAQDLPQRLAAAVADALHDAEPEISLP